MIVVWSYKPREQGSEMNESWKISIRKIDILTPALLTSSLTALLFALQLGGIVYSWSSAKVIGCLVAFGTLSIVFVILQWLRQEQ